VAVSLQAEGDRLVLEVADNGRGITANELKNPRAYGLIGMRERVLAIQGKFAIVGEPGRGTRVTVTLPLQRRDERQ
jgi:signal transduction histidine kinase